MSDDGDSFCAVEGMITQNIEARERRKLTDPVTVEEACQMLKLIRRLINMIFDDAAIAGEEFQADCNRLIEELECESP